MSNNETTGTVKLHRVIRSTPERIYRAFTSPDALAKWMPPNGFFAKVYQMDLKVGGTYRMSFTNLTTGTEMFFGGEYLELVENEKIVNTDRFEGDALPGEMKTTVVLKKVSVGTELNITQEGIPAAIPVEGCYLGWHDSLTLLTMLVEPEIPDGCC